jgi:hypothetical protein
MPVMPKCITGCRPSPSSTIQKLASAQAEALKIRSRFAFPFTRLDGTTFDLFCLAMSGVSITQQEQLANCSWSVPPVYTILSSVVKTFAILYPTQLS